MRSAEGIVMCFIYVRIVGFLVGVLGVGVKSILMAKCICTGTAGFLGFEGVLIEVYYLR